MSNSIGYATFQLVPVAPNISQQITQIITTPLQRAGQLAGQQGGQAIAQGLRSQVSTVEQASRALAGARDREADAAGRVRVAEANLQQLRSQGVTSGARLVRAEEDLERARRGNASATGQAQRAQRDLAEATRNTAQANQQVASSTSDASSATGGLSERFKGAAGDLKTFAAGAFGVAAAMKVITDAMDFEVINDNLAASLGATPEVAKQYGETTANVYKQAFGDSMETVAEAVGSVSSSFKTLGTDGEQSLESATKMGLTFAQVFKTDIGESVQTASQLVTNGLAKNSTEAFDLMTAAFQRVPAAMRGELPEILNQYGTNFRALGFDGEQSFNLLIAAANKGKFALDKTGDALKEFTIRGSDMSKTSVDAYTRIGLDAEEMSNKIAQGGPVAQEALQATAKGLLGIIDPQERANTAIALFGTPLEDLSVDQIPQFLEALTGSEKGMDNFAGSTNRMIDTVGDNGTSKIEAFKRSVQVGLVDALNEAVSYMGNTAIPAFKSFADNIGLTDVATKVTEAFKGEGGLVDGVKAALEELPGAVATFFTEIPGKVSEFVRNLDWSDTVSSIADGIKNFISSGGPVFVAAIAALPLVLAGALLAAGLSIAVGLVDGLVRGFSDRVWPWFKELPGRLGDMFSDAGSWLLDKGTAIVDGLREGFVSAWTTVIGFIAKLPGEISEKATGLFDGFKDAFKAAINWIIEKWNSLDFTVDIPKVHIPGTNVDIGGGSITLGLPDIPYLAGGGVAGRTNAGRLWGPGNGTSDSILGVDQWGMPTAFVSTREGVVKEHAMDNGGAQLVAALNGGWVPSADFLHRMVPGLATGGTPLEAWNGGGGEDHLQPSAIVARRLIHKYWPEIAEIGGYRADGGGFNDHPSGLALDIMTTDVPLGTSIKDWLHQNAGPLALNYTIWQQRYEPVDGQGNVMEDRGSPTQNHMDHVHALFNALGVDPNMMPSGIQPPTGADATTSATTSAVTSDQAAAAQAATSPAGGTRLKTLHELGSDLGGILADGLVETFDIPSWIADPNQLLQGDDGSNVRTSATSTSTSSSSPSSSSKPNESAAAVAGTPDARNGLSGSALYSYDLVKVAKDMGLPEAAAIIGNAVGLVETNLQMYANSNVPESLTFPHDAVGTDHDSVGVMQQRFPMWGPLDVLMNSQGSARLFYEALQKTDWQSMDPGAAAQAVQRSAYPGKYGERMDEAAGLVKKASLFDTGGMLMPGQLSLSLLKKPEPLLPAERWATAERSMSLVEQLAAGAQTNGRRENGGDTYNAFGYTAGEIADEWERRQWARTGGQDGRSW